MDSALKNAHIQIGFVFFSSNKRVLTIILIGIAEIIHCKFSWLEVHFSAMVFSVKFFEMTYSI